MLAQSPVVHYNRSTTLLLAFAGVFLLACCTAIALLSRYFSYGTDMADRPILLFIALMMAAVLPYFLGVYLAPRSAWTRILAWWIFIIGAAMRLLFASSQPILEDDFYRYLWDGALTAHGYNPYTTRPADALAEGNGIPIAIAELARESHPILARVNHPELGTIYPPVAQFFFAIAHWIAPWQTAGLRVLYYLADCAVFALLLALLGQLNRAPALVLIYWWNPLCAKELYNSLHMDILLLPWLLVALLVLLRGRPALASGALALATAVKLWPILVLAPLLATLRTRPRAILACAAVFATTAMVLLAPMVATRLLGGSSGLAAYSTRWEMNDALFLVFPWTLDHVASLLGHEMTRGDLHRGGKAIAACVLLLILFGTCRRLAAMEVEAPNRKHQVATAVLIVVAALFLLSPTQFPWYFTWIAPLLVLVPSRALLLLTFTLPLYYLKFYLDARGQVQLFHHGIVWLEYVPVWLLLVWDWGRGPRREGVNF